MALIDFLANNLKLLHKVKNIPTSESKNGFYYFVSEDGARKGVYVVSAKKTYKIFDTDDYYVKTEADAKLTDVETALKKLIDGGYLGVRKSYETLVIANADKNPTDLSNEVIKVGQLVSVVGDSVAENNGIYRLASLAEDGMPTWERQAGLGNMKEYAKSGGSVKTLKDAETELDKLFKEETIDSAYVHIFRDVLGILLGGVKKDGYWMFPFAEIGELKNNQLLNAGIAANNNAETLNKVFAEQNINGEYIHVFKDLTDKILGGVKKNGAWEFYRAFIANMDIEIDSNKEVLILKDKGNRALLYVDKEGVHIPLLQADSIDKKLSDIETSINAISAAIPITAYASENVKNNVFKKKGFISTNGDKKIKIAAFSIHDDDSIDTKITSSMPSGWMIGGGYASVLYPLLESLDMRGCLAAEGQRIGLEIGNLNANGNVIKRLQDEKGWEVMSHTMTARYELNNYLVDKLDSTLADTIKTAGRYDGVNANTTTSVYVSSEKKCYQLNASKEWVTVVKRNIKPYVQDFNTKKVIMRCPVFPTDFQFGDFKAIAEKNGLHIENFVVPAGTCDHEMYAESSKYYNGHFTYAQDGTSNETDSINTPPLCSYIIRVGLELYKVPNYQGELSTDNTSKPERLAVWKQIIDKAIKMGGYVAFCIHTYRPCWLNKLPGALVSEGGTYPDSWVYPLRDIGAYPDNYLDPPTEKGINKWSDWHPCPGTLLHDFWELLKYAKSKNILNLTSKEAMDIWGNNISVGYYSNSVKVGFDRIMSTSKGLYPHYVEGKDGSVRYYNN